jgi:hypothetical protein
VLKGGEAETEKRLGRLWMRAISARWLGGVPIAGKDSTPSGPQTQTEETMQGKKKVTRVPAGSVIEYPMIGPVADTVRYCIRWGGNSHRVNTGA